jgi:hypothetical protein
MGHVGNRQTGNTRNTYKILNENSCRSIHLEDIGTDKRIILKWIC